MGSWNATCHLSNLPIRRGEKVVVIVYTEKDSYEATKGYYNFYPNSCFTPFLPPIYGGVYDDYGRIEGDDLEENNKVVMDCLKCFKFIQSGEEITFDSIFDFISKLERVDGDDDIYLHRKSFCYGVKEKFKVKFAMYHADIYFGLLEAWKEKIAFREMEEKLKGYENEFKSLNAVNDDLNKQLDNYELKIQNLENTIDLKDKAHKVLQDTYNELFVENTKLKEDLENRIKQIRATEKTYDEEQKKIIAARDEFITKYNQSKEIIEQLKKDNKESEEAAKKVMDSYENDLNTYKAKEIELTNKLDESIKNNKELQDKYDNLDKICNDFENQKLAWEGDYQGLAEMYYQLQNEYDRLSNQTDIYSQSDDTLAEIIKIMVDKGLVNTNEITPKTAIKESGTAHRMGDNLEGGKNIGV